MKKANWDLRIFIVAKGLKQYELAKVMGIGETTLCRKLRNELSARGKEEIYDAIGKLENRLRQGEAI
jgi:hypothetical protein